MKVWGFLDRERALAIREEYGSPVYVYDESRLREQIKTVRGFPNAYGLTLRYAMKACPTAAILKIFEASGIDIDASSGYEAERAMRAGFAPERIQITAQELPANLKELVERGVLINATSLHQLESYGALFPGAEVSIRVNPGLGSGHNNRTNVGGPSSSFGIWRDHLDRVEEIRARHDLTISRVHSHIGSGGDPEVWKRCAELSLAIAAKLPDVTRINLGGGFKVARVEGETSANVHEIGEALLPHFHDFAREHGRELHLELEPGTLYVAQAGALIATVMDVVDTGPDGYRFIKVDSGMTENLRPSMYGAQHPMAVAPADDTDRAETDYLVVGHCCESGDILTPQPGDPEGLGTRRLLEARIGDALVIGATGAYCSSMTASNYNSFPRAAEVLITESGDAKLIRERQTLDDVLAGEIS